LGKANFKAEGDLTFNEPWRVQLNSVNTHAMGRPVASEHNKQLGLCFARAVTGEGLVLCWFQFVLLYPVLLVQLVDIWCRPFLLRSEVASRQ